MPQHQNSHRTFWAGGLGDCHYFLYPPFFGVSLYSPLTKHRGSGRCILNPHQYNNNNNNNSNNNNNNNNDNNSCYYYYHYHHQTMLSIAQAYIKMMFSKETGYNQYFINNGYNYSFSFISLLALFSIFFLSPIMCSM